MKFSKTGLAVAAAVAIVLLGAGARLIFPGAVQDLLSRGGALAFRAWNGTFGAPREEYIDGDGDISASDTPQSDTSTAILSASATDDHADPFDNELSAAIPAKTAKKAPAAPKKKSAAAGSGAVPADTENNSGGATDGTERSGPAATPAAAPSSSAVAPAPKPSCTISTSAAVSKKIILNEIAWMGSLPASGETASAASGREWFELKNNSSGSIDLSNWQVLDRSGAVNVVFGDDDSISPQGYFLLARGTDSVAGVAADKKYSGGLANAGDVLEIFDPQCGASDVIDASAGWPAGNNSTKATLERDDDGIGWHTSVDPGGTPGAANSDPAPAIEDHPTIVDPAIPVSTPPASSEPAPPPAPTSTPASAPDPTSSDQTALPASSTHILIIEVQIGGASSTNDLIKLFNPGTASIDMGGWKLRKRSSTGTESSLRVMPSGSSIGAGGSFVWANSSGGFGDGINADATSSETLAADNSAAILDASGTIVDAVAWGTGSGQFVEGSAYPVNPTADQVLARIESNGAFVDTNDNATDFTLRSR